MQVRMAVQSNPVKPSQTQSNQIFLIVTEWSSPGSRRPERAKRLKLRNEPKSKNVNLTVQQMIRSCMCSVTGSKRTPFNQKRTGICYAKTPGHPWESGKRGIPDERCQDSESDSQNEFPDRTSGQGRTPDRNSGSFEILKMDRGLNPELSRVKLSSINRQPQFTL